MNPSKPWINTIKKLFTLLICLSALSLQAEAAYRIGERHSDNRREVVVSEDIKQTVRDEARLAQHRDDEKLPSGAKKASIWDNMEGLISFTTGLTAATMAVLALLLVIDLSPVIAAIGISSAIIAIIAGAKGRKQKPRGFAIAGLSLGIAVIAGAITLSLLLLLLIMIL